MIEFKDNNQLKSFMKKEAKRLNIGVNNTYKTYFSRYILERVSKHNREEILVKGSSAEIAYMGKLVRAVTDIDLASLKSFNESINLLTEIVNDNEETSLNLSFMNGFKQTPTGIYKLAINAHTKKINQPIGIDFQENYHRLIEPGYQLMPAIFENDKPFEIYAPSFEEYLAEKLCIILESNKEDILNTRVKDFYDIYQLHGGKYDYDKLTEYFRKMLKLRNKVKLENAHTVNLNENFVERHKEIWDETKTKYDFIDKEIDLAGAVYYTRAVLREQLQKSGQEMEDQLTLQYKK